MSKNLTRKGLAFGALVALGTTLFAGAPAFASDELTLAPSAGTLYKTIEGEAFTLSTGPAAAYTSANMALLKYQVVTSGSVSVRIQTDDAIAGAAAVGTPTGGASQPANTTVYVKNAGDPASASGVAQSIEVTSTSAIAAGTPLVATVTSFLDGNSNNLLDAGEYSSSARAISWVDATDVVTTTTISPVVSGATTASAKLSFNDINNHQVALANVGVNFTKGNGDALAGAGVVLIKSGTTPALTFSASTGLFSATTAAFTAVVTTAGSEVNNIVKATPVYLAAGNPATTNTIGTAVLSTAAAKTVETVSVDASATVGAKVTATASGTTTIVAKPNASYTLTASLTDATVAEAAVAGATVSVNFTANSALSATRTLTINGTTYSTGAALTGGTTLATPISLTSDAAGKVSITVSSVGLVDTNTLAFTFTSQGVLNTATVTYGTPVYKIVSAANDPLNEGLTVVKGSTYSLNYKVLDQFGDAPSTATNTVYRIVNTVTGAGAGTVNATVGADGSASFSFVNASAAAGTSTNTLALQSSRDGFATTAVETNAAPGIASTVVKVVATASEVAANSITLGTLVAGANNPDTGNGATAATAARVASTSFKNYDFRTTKGKQPTLFAGYTALRGLTAGSTAERGAITLPISVLDNAGSIVKGLPVTISGAGLFFTVGTAGSTIVAGDGSLTIVSGAAATNVNIYSHKSGKTTVSVVAGSVTKTKDIYFETVDGEGVDLKLTAPASVRPGATLTVSGSVVDQWGNSVKATTTAINASTTDAGVASTATGKLGTKFDASYKGPGLVFPSASETLTATGNDGTFKFTVLVGTTDSGTATVSASYDTNTALTTDVILTKTASVVVGDAPVAAAAKANVVAKTKAFSVSVSGNAAAKNVVVKVAGKTVATLKGSASAKTYTVKATKGSKKVTVYVGGKLIATKTVSVK